MLIYRWLLTSYYISGGRGWRLPRITACAMLWVSQKLSFLTRNRSFCEHIDVLAKIQGDIRNQRMKLHRVMCDTIHFLAKKVFRKISLGSPTGDFGKKNNFSKNGLFWQSWFSEWYITHSEQQKPVSKQKKLHVRLLWESYPLCDDDVTDTMSISQVMKFHWKN